MAPGDTLVLYTDGVTEAMDEAMALYGEDRLQAFLESADPALSPAELERAIRRDIARFVGAAEQADDITLLVLRYLG